MRGFQLQWEGSKSPQGAYLIDSRDGFRWNIVGLQSGYIHTDKGILPKGFYTRTIECGRTQGNRILMDITAGPNDPKSHPQQVIATKPVPANLQEVFIEVSDEFTLFDSSDSECKEFASLEKLEQLAGELE